MRWVKTFLVMTLAVFWTLVTNHCRLENLPCFAFLSCVPSNAGGQHESSDCGDDGCGAVESGFYKSEEHTIDLESPASLPIYTMEPTGLAAPEADASSAISLPGAAPPEQISSWQFFTRAASSPRAPSIRS